MIGLDTNCLVRYFPHDDAAQFSAEDKDVALRALDDFRNSRANFADCLTGRKNAMAGCHSTITFDKGTNTLAAYELLGKR